MKSIVDISHEFLLPVLHNQAICIDATWGHGKDSAFFLKQNVRKVYAFEIQEEVFKETSIKYPEVIGFNQSHENIDQIPEKVDAIIFNFGYCPGVESDVMTQANTSLMAVKKGLNQLRKKGRMALVFYPHEQGKEEAHVIQQYLSTLDSSEYSLIQIQRLFVDSPYLIGIEKR